jgi:hypothetical protein
MGMAKVIVLVALRLSLATVLLNSPYTSWSDNSMFSHCLVEPAILADKRLRRAQLWARRLRAILGTGVLVKGRN